jgi:5'-3' exonuclease
VTWLVILVWVAAVGFSGFWLARVGLSLARKSQGLIKAAEPLAANVAELARVAHAVTSYEAKPDNLQDSPVEHLKAVREQRKARERRALDRQRRLIDRLKP